jgi:hypothetical protein
MKNEVRYHHLKVLENEEHDDADTGTKKVSLYATDLDSLEKKRLTTTTVAGKSALDVSPRPPSYALRLAESAPYTYIGKAVTGSDEGDAVWQIFRMDETSGLAIEWADGDSSFNNIWTNYATLSYS